MIHFAFSTQYIAPDLSYGGVNIYVFITKHALKRRASILDAQHVSERLVRRLDAIFSRSAAAATHLYV